MKELSEYGKIIDLDLFESYSKMNGSEAGVLFALKAYLTLKPI